MNQTKSTSPYTDILIRLGLSKNESRIYETLLIKGESPVGSIATVSTINRRNVYDSLNRLIEKGLAFQIIQKGENIYRAVNPRKLMELLKEKEASLDEILPELTELFNSKPHDEDIYLYRGVEGWKNFMRDILTRGEDVYIIGGKGAWAEPKLDTFRTQFLKDIEKAGIKIKVLYDHEIYKTKHKILEYLNSEHRFLPKGFSSTAAVTVFGDQVVIQSKIKIGQIDDTITSTVMINESTADMFRTWFELLWKSAKVK